jgi:magnesium chelatase family protein
LLDRIDLQIEVPALPADALSMARGGNHARLESSAIVRERVAHASDRQLSRQGKANAVLQPRDIERWCALDDDGEALIKNAFARLSLSARAYHRILKVARTIADLAASDKLAARHVAEAISYRRLDRT